MKRNARTVAASVSVLALSATILTLSMWSDGTRSESGGADAPAATIPLAVLGDSNSHSYQDQVSFPADSTERGGERRPHTFQWTEVLVRLRGHELDLGPWVSWGRPGWVARARELVGLPGARAPKKQDYLYNFANSGAACKNLVKGRFRQAPRLVALMDEEPERWKRGVVVIRIGLNNWAGLLDLQARDPLAAELRQVVDYCAGEIGDAVALIHASHPFTRVLLLGIGNEADDPDYFDRWHSGAETANIATALEGFNGAIRQLAIGQPRVAFFDDAAWFRSRWGSRGADGKPAYRTVAIGSSLRVTNTAGDDPRNTLVHDHHPGLALNALLAQALVVRLREAFDLPLTPIGDEEVARFVERLAVAPRVPGS